MAEVLCGSCVRPVTDNAVLCGGCTDRLFADLGAVAELIEDLTVTRSKQDNISHRQARVSGTKDKPLGFRPAAIEAHDLIRMTLVYWVRIIAAACQAPTFDVHAESPSALALWLARHRETIRQHSDGAAMVDEMHYAVETGRRAIDRPAQRIYAGPCECGADLYAREKAREVMCRDCEARYSVDDRRAWMLDEVREHFATASEIAAGIGELHGQAINRKTINKWNSRDRLIVRGYSSDGYPLFKIGDVLDLAVANSARRIDPGGDGPGGGVSP